jgi:hypothetical protein
MTALLEPLWWLYPSNSVSINHCVHTTLISVQDRAEQYFRHTQRAGIGKKMLPVNRVIGCLEVNEVTNRGHPLYLAMLMQWRRMKAAWRVLLLGMKNRLKQHVWQVACLLAITKQKERGRVLLHQQDT